MTRFAGGVVAAALVFLATESASAQPSASAARIEIAIGQRWMGGQAIAAGDANETTSTGAPFRLFTASARVAGATSFDIRVGVRILRRLEAEVSGGYGRPQLRISVSRDVEGGAALTATERLQEFTVRGGASWHLRTVGRSRLTPFVAVAAGNVRALHEGHTLVQTGRAIEIGGGAKYPFLSRNGRLKGFGARIDARAVVRSKGVATDDRLHTTPAVGASIYVGF